MIMTLASYTISITISFLILPHIASYLHRVYTLWKSGVPFFRYQLVFDVRRCPSVHDLPMDAPTVAVYAKTMEASDKAIEYIHTHLEGVRAVELRDSQIGLIWISFDESEHFEKAMDEMKKQTDLGELFCMCCMGAFVRDEYKMW